MTIYQELKQAGCTIDHHESDLYVKNDPSSREIIARWKEPTAKSFWSDLDQSWWTEIPFAYDPFWFTAALAAKGARRDRKPITRYLVNLTNHDDCMMAGPISFGTGRYGFTVRAETIQDAIDAVIARARSDGFYGHDWEADIKPLDARGQVDRASIPPFSTSSATLGLYDTARPEWLESYGLTSVPPASSFGGVRLW